MGLLFFQAEDGIRDLVRSRGLGDVYKRQGFDTLVASLDRTDPDDHDDLVVIHGDPSLPNLIPVSYTHLTLPTSDLV